MVLRPMIGALTIWITATPLHGQTLDLDGRPECGQCRPAVVLKEQIDFRRADASPSYDPSVTGEPEGMWLIASRTFGGELAAYTDGLGLDFIGREGQGPGEFKGMITVRSNGIYYFTHDFSNNRFTRIHTNHSIGDQFPAGGLIRDWRVTSDGQIFAAGVFSDGGVQYGFMMFNPTDDTRTYGVPLTPENLEDPALLTPLMSLDGRGNAIIGSRFGGKLRQVRLSDLSVTWEAQIKLSGLATEPVQVQWNTTPPPTQMVGVFHDRVGNIWLLMSTADDEWEAGARERRDSPHTVFDSRWYVIRDRDKAYIAEGRHNLLIAGGDRGNVYLYMDDSDAVGTFSLWLDRR